MKKIIPITLVLMHLIACNKDGASPELHYPDHIVSGTTDGPGVFYSGIINDTILFSGGQIDTTIYLDINDNGIKDFGLRYRCGASPGSFRSKSVISPLGNSYIVVPNDADTNIADTVSVNQIIDNELRWVNEVCTLYFAQGGFAWDNLSIGLWNGATDKYIGLKLHSEDEVYFGWIRVDIWDGWRLVLIDYACTVGYER